MSGSHVHYAWRDGRHVRHVRAFGGEVVADVGAKELENLSLGKRLGQLGHTLRAELVLREGRMARLRAWFCHLGGIGAKYPTVPYGGGMCPTDYDTILSRPRPRACADANGRE